MSTLTENSISKKLFAKTACRKFAETPYADGPSADDLRRCAILRGSLRCGLRCKICLVLVPRLLVAVHMHHKECVCYSAFDSASSCARCTVELAGRDIALDARYISHVKGYVGGYRACCSTISAMSKAMWAAGQYLLCLITRRTVDSMPSGVRILCMFDNARVRCTRSAGTPENDLGFTAVRKVRSVKACICRTRRTVFDEHRVLG